MSLQVEQSAPVFSISVPEPTQTIDELKRIVETKLDSLLAKRDFRLTADLDLYLNLKIEERDIFPDNFSDNSLEIAELDLILNKIKDLDYFRNLQLMVEKKRFEMVVPKPEDLSLEGVSPKFIIAGEPITLSKTEMLRLQILNIKREQIIKRRQSVSIYDDTETDKVISGLTCHTCGRRFSTYHTRLYSLLEKAGVPTALILDVLLGNYEHRLIWSTPRKQCCSSILMLPPRTPNESETLLKQREERHIALGVLRKPTEGMDETKWLIELEKVTPETKATHDYKQSPIPKMDRRKVLQNFKNRIGALREKSKPIPSTPLDVEVSLMPSDISMTDIDLGIDLTPEMQNPIDMDVEIEDTLIEPPSETSLDSITLDLPNIASLDLTADTVAPVSIMSKIEVIEPAKGRTGSDELIARMKASVVLPDIALGHSVYRAI